VKGVKTGVRNPRPSGCLRSLRLCYAAHCHIFKITYISKQGAVTAYNGHIVNYKDTDVKSDTSCKFIPLLISTYKSTSLVVHGYTVHILTQISATIEILTIC
jgi:hypothetical protein